MKASLDFGSKLTMLCVLKVLEEDFDEWGYTYGDVIKHELKQSGSDFTVVSEVNGAPLSLGGSGGTMSLDDFNDFMIEKMYYGSIADCQKESGAENPENHLTRDSADSETNAQWWAKQKKYEDRVFLKNTLDTSPLELHTMDRAGDGVDARDDASAMADDEPTRSPSATEVTIGSTSESDTATAISTDLTLGSSSEIMDENTFQFNTLDAVGNFERTSGEDISIAHGEQVSLGLDNVATHDVQHNLFKDIELPTSQSTDIQFAPTHQVMLDGSEDTMTSPSGKALQLNHYVPIEVDRMKATVDQNNAISLLGGNDIADNHIYSEKIRQNTLRGVTIEQGEHYKVDLSNVDPENAAVTGTQSGDDSFHVEGTSKTKPAGESSNTPPPPAP